MTRELKKNEEEELSQILEHLSLNLYRSGQTKGLKGANMISTHPSLPLAFVNKEDNTREANDYKRKITNLMNAA